VESRVAIEARENALGRRDVVSGENPGDIGDPLVADFEEPTPAANHVNEIGPEIIQGLGKLGRGIFARRIIETEMRDAGKFAGQDVGAHRDIATFVDSAANETDFLGAGSADAKAGQTCDEEDLHKSEIRMPKSDLLKSEFRIPKSETNPNDPMTEGDRRFTTLRETTRRRVILSRLTRHSSYYLYRSFSAARPGNLG
jgi:hypothetical protein